MVAKIKQFLRKSNTISEIEEKTRYKRLQLRYKYYPEKTMKKLYKDTYGKELDILHPKTFSEKLIYINLYSQNPLATKLADKYEMRDYVSKLGYKEILVKLLGVYDSVEQIDFKQLPNKFVLKCNHGCGYNIICTDKDKLDIQDTKEKLNKWMKENYAYYAIEKQYENIKPRIICEEYIDELGKGVPTDYKIYCINGEPTLTQCCFDRENKVKLAYYDLEWQSLDYSSREIDKAAKLEMPSRYKEMIEIARKLSKPFDYVRVDFYQIEDKILLGELTFTPAGCRLKYLNREAEMKLGEQLKISNVNK